MLVGKRVWLADGRTPGMNRWAERAKNEIGTLQLCYRFITSNIVSGDSLVLLELGLRIFHQTEPQ